MPRHPRALLVAALAVLATAAPAGAAADPGPLPPAPVGVELVEVDETAYVHELARASRQQTMIQVAHRWWNVTLRSGRLPTYVTTPNAWDCAWRSDRPLVIDCRIHLKRPTGRTWRARVEVRYTPRRSCPSIRPVVHEDLSGWARFPAGGIGCARFDRITPTPPGMVAPAGASSTSTRPDYRGAITYPARYGEYGEPDAAYITEQRQQLHRVPARLAAELVEAGVRWQIGSVPVGAFPGTEHYAALPAVGYPAGVTFGEISGAYDPTTRTATIGRGVGVNPVLALHETGHAVWQVLELVANADLERAWLADQARGPLPAYYLQAGGRGRGEWFADVFAYGLAEGPGPVEAMFGREARRALAGILRPFRGASR